MFEFIYKTDEKGERKRTRNGGKVVKAAATAACEEKWRM